MNLKQLEYFVGVAELGSFSKAAAVLNIAQPALSRQVRLLETGLRVALLLRNGRGVVLTEAGQRLFDHSVGILQLVSRVREDVAAARDEPAGRIVVGLPPSMGRLLTVPLVEGFRRSLPKARLSVVEGLSAHLAEWISTGRVDIGLLHNPEPQPALDITPVLDESLCLVSPAATPGKSKAVRKGGRKEEHKVSAGRTASLDELTRLPLILPERSHAMRKLLETQAALTGHKLNVVLEVSSVQAILDLVRAGFGHALLTPSALALSADAAAYAMRPLADPPLISTLCLAVSAHKPATPLSKHVFRLLRELAATAGSQLTHNNLR